MTSFDDVVRARWRLLAEPEDPNGRVRHDAMREHFERTHGRIVAARAQRLAVADLFTRSRHVMAALEAS